MHTGDDQSHLSIYNHAQTVWPTHTMMSASLICNLPTVHASSMLDDVFVILTKMNQNESNRVESMRVSPRINFPLTLSIFCKVVDNYGDIGICWRLARQLQHEQGVAVTLWVDDLASFQRICPEVMLDADLQKIASVTIRHWLSSVCAQDMAFTADDISDVVIEFFACDIPPAYIASMVQCHPQPVWLNLEGLTAEEWVEGCHTLPSSHPQLPLTKYFFFPGFTAKTGGLLCESELSGQRQPFQADAKRKADFLSALGLTAAEIASLKVSLFCYAHAPVAQLFDAWQQGDTAITCLVPESVAAQAVQGFFANGSGMSIKAGAVCTRGALTIRVLPFITQPDYDKLLWACDLNFVRGEDSFVRAQWANKPFIWHIYPQDENLHHKKLRAFLQAYAQLDDPLSTFSLAWNHALSESGDIAGVWTALWPQLHDAMPEISKNSVLWQQKMQKNGDLAANLLRFTEVLHLESVKK